MNYRHRGFHVTWNTTSTPPRTLHSTITLLYDGERGSAAQKIATLTLRTTEWIFLGPDRFLCCLCFFRMVEKLNKLNNWSVKREDRYGPLASRWYKVRALLPGLLPLFLGTRE